MNKIFSLAFALYFSPITYASEAVNYFFGLTVEHIQNVNGGVKTGSSSLLSADLTALTDTQAAGWWNNGEFFGYILGNYGKEPANLSGNWQGMSNIAAANEFKLYELWYQHRFFEDTTKILIGLHDYNSSFYSLDSASHFTSPPFGIGSEVAQVSPSIFPTTAFATVISVDIQHYYIRLALYDGIAGHPQGKTGTYIRFEDGDGLFRAVELGVADAENFKLGIGFWQHTAEVENPISGNTSDNNSGLYAIGEWSINEQFTVFVQTGAADDKKNQVDRYSGVGAVLTDVWLEADALGLALAHANNSKAFLDQNPGLISSENIWELSYKFNASQYASIQTSAYYIDSPNMQNSIDNALAFGIRFILAIQ